ncbi:MAG: hypothetical protein JRJ87_21720 [Deltaproteobacteria bacterium]|nr:hypothetical protein [Deltaproteobacteria bacterium]
MRIAIGILFIGVLTGCGVSEGDFIAGADYDPCQSNIPICQQTAGCAMGENKYTSGDFPGYVNFLVTTPADTTIIVKLFFKTREHPGEDTEIIWYEPGCHDSYSYESQGKDIFAIAGGDRVFAQEQMVRREGDHLIEVYSDSLTEYFVRVELETPMN